MKNRLIVMTLLASAITSLALAKPKESEGLLNRLLAPGKLMEGHKDLEGSDCLKCHDVGKGVPSLKCLECHDQIQTAVKEKKGFHGKATKSCISCHRDHQGRLYDSTLVDEKKFDHKQTGFNLEGAHAKIECRKCHNELRTEKPIRQKGIRYFGKTTTCRSCHEKDDIHYFENEWKTKDCSVCHTSSTTWKKTTAFNHEKQTGFPLNGQHSKLKCASCHKKEGNKDIKYDWPELKSKGCLSCHQDYHKDGLSGKFAGGNCAQCHSEVSWSIKVFNHEATGFALKDAHAKLKCADCHKAVMTINPSTKKTPIKWSDVPSSCGGCHGDHHLFGNHQSERLKNPQDCGQCHNELKWSVIRNFDHNTTTRYKLVGKHEQTKCEKCHIPTEEIRASKQGIYSWPELEMKTCENCHRSPHLEEFSEKIRLQKCSTCHTEIDWKTMAKGPEQFDHGRDTRFELKEKHTSLACLDCHDKKRTPRYKFENYEKNFCVDCHANVHTDQFHEKLSQAACSSCHNQESFTQAIHFDHKLSQYPLEGKHQNVACRDCHTPTTEVFPGPQNRKKHKFIFPNWAPQKCETCHKDVHRGNYVNACAECHSELGWKETRDYHKNFTLKGVHYQLQCAECHQDNRRLKGASENCVSCHQKDDPHNGSLNRCGDCHRQDFWENLSFRHSLTQFPLMGAHRSLECVDCHRGGMYRGLSSNCISCHSKDASGVAFPNHQLSGFQNCSDCHNQFSFE